MNGTSLPMAALPSWGARLVDVFGGVLAAGLPGRAEPWVARGRSLVVNRTARPDARCHGTAPISAQPQVRAGTLLPAPSPVQHGRRVGGRSGQAGRVTGR